VRLTITQAVPVRGLLTQRRRRQLSNTGTIVLYLLPSIALFALFVIFPVVQAAHYSLYRWNGLTSLDDYIGIKNYRTLFHDPIFLTAVKNNLLIAVLSLLIQLPAAIVLALLLNQKIPGRTFFRTIFFLPYVLSEVVTGLIWSFIYNPSNGLVAGLLHQFNPHAVPPAWLGDTHTVLFAIFAAMCWKYVGFHFVLYVAGLQNIPAEVVEAARMDGANSWQIARYVTLPLLGSTIRLSAFLSILGSLQYFDLIYVMSNGGPVNASETMATYQLHYGLQEFALGYGSAVGVVMFAVCLIFALLYQRVIMRQDLQGSSAL
jgi:raffinose/stachyose/melibiose transport system permease protein